MKFEEACAESYDNYLQKANKLAWVFGIIAGISGVVFSIAGWMNGTRNIHGLVMLPIFLGIAFGGLVLGIALLFAPGSFYQTGKGKDWLKFIGTKDVLAARIAILFVMILFCLFIFLVGLGVLNLMGYIGNQPEPESPTQQAIPAPPAKSPTPVFPRITRRTLPGTTKSTFNDKWYLQPTFGKQAETP